MSVFGGDTGNPPQDPNQYPAPPGEPWNVTASGYTPQAPYGAPEPPAPRYYGRVGRVPWTFAQTLLGTAITLVPWVSVLVLTQVATPSNVPLERVPVAEDVTAGIIIALFTALVEGAFLLVPLYFAVWRRAPGVSRREGLYALGFRRTPLAPALAWIVGGMAIIFLAVGPLYDALIRVFNLHVQTNVDTLMEQARYAPFTVLGALVGAVLIAPFCEEVFFRGFLFGGLLRGMGVWLAVPLSALLFGIAHGDIGSFVLLFAIGIVLAVVRWRTGSIWPGMVLHAANNAIAAVYVIALIMGR